MWTLWMFVRLISNIVSDFSFSQLSDFYFYFLFRTSLIFLIIYVDSCMLVRLLTTKNALCIFFSHCSFVINIVNSRFIDWCIGLNIEKCLISIKLSRSLIFNKSSDSFRWVFRSFATCLNVYEHQSPFAIISVFTKKTFSLLQIRL